MSRDKEIEKEIQYKGLTAPKGLGEKIAHRNAADKIWSLERYLLKQRLYEQS